MSIAPNCHLCSKPLEDFGALAFSPPDHFEDCHKYHICRGCWSEVQKALDGNGWIPVDDFLPLDHIDDPSHVVTDVLVCGLWDEDEPPPNTHTCVVGYNGATGGWTFAGHFSKPWPYQDKITHWMPFPSPHPKSGETRVTGHSRERSIWFAKRRVAFLARDLADAAEKIAPDDSFDPSLVELRAVLEHMAFELEHRHSELEPEL